MAIGVKLYKMQDVGFGGAKRNGNPQQCNLLESLEVSLVLFVHNLDPFRCVNACVGSLHLGQTCATCALYDFNLSP